jgi:predicted O-methyltransferase YrrM
MSDSNDPRLIRNVFESPIMGAVSEAPDSPAAHSVERLLDARHGLIQIAERGFLFGLLCALPQKFIRAVEIGTWTGTTMHVLRRACDELYCIDPEPQWQENPEHRTRSGNPVRLIKGYSPRDLEKIPAPFTFVFVDGDHSEQGVYRDTMALEPLMERGGIICFHDANHPPVEKGLLAASNEWKRKHNLFHRACDTLSQTPDGIFGGISVITVESDPQLDAEPFSYLNP